MTVDEMRLFRRANGNIVLTYRTSADKPYTLVSGSSRHILYAPVHKAGDMDDGGPHSTLTIVTRHTYVANVSSYWVPMFGNGIYRDPNSTYGNIPNYTTTRRGAGYHYETSHPENSQTAYSSMWITTYSGVTGVLGISKWDPPRTHLEWYHPHMVKVTLSDDYYSKVYTQWSNGLTQEYRKVTQYPLLADRPATEGYWRLGGGYYDGTDLPSGDTELPGDFRVTTVWSLPNDLTLLMGKDSGGWLKWAYSPELACSDTVTLISATFS